jgi:hypothetical protein
MEADMTVYDLFAVQSIGEDEFQLYRAAVVACGVVLVGLAWWGIGAATIARVISAVVGVILLAYGVYLWFLLTEGEVYDVYTFLFILPLLVVGYQLYSRVLNREVDEAVRRQLEAERAARAAARAGDAGAPPEADAPPRADPAQPPSAPPVP